MVEIAFYGGAGEIGGNKLLMKGSEARFWLDFGISFKKHGQYFSEFLQPRTSNALGDYLALGLIPKLDCLYRNDFLAHNKMAASEKPGFDGVLISHAHFDHLGYVGLLHEDMQIFCSSVTRDIASVLDELGSGSQADMLKTTKSFSYYINKKGERSRIKHSKDQAKYSPRRYPLSFMSGEFQVGKASAEIFPVDHSIAGASGYIIHLDGKTICYTGDMRFHGARQKQTEAFVRKMSDARPDILLVEGTNVGEKKGMTEAQVKAELARLMASAEGKHVFAAFPARDTDRLMSFYAAAKESGRKLAIDFKQAFLLDTLSKNDALEHGRDILPSNDKNLAVYLKKREYGLIGEAGVDLDEKCRDYDSNARPYVGVKNQVCWRDLKEHPGDYVMYLDNYSIQELVDIKPASGSVYIKSQCEPFDLEMELDWARIENWLDLFGLGIEKAHASGHMFGEEIAEVIGQVDPKLVIPVHTQNPGEFRRLCKSQIFIPEENKNFGF